IILTVSIYSISNYKYERRDLFWILIMLFIIFLSIFTLLYSDSVVASREKLIQLLLTFLFFVSGLNCARVFSLEKIVNISIVYISIITTVYLYIYIFIAGGDLSIFKALSQQQDSRVIADYLLLSIIVYPLLYLKFFFGKKDIFFLLIFFSSLFCISLGGRGPFISLLIITLIPFLLRFRKYYKHILVGVLILLLIVLYTGVFDTFLARFDTINSSGGDISLQSRFKEYSIAFESISDNPILGSGIGMSGIILGYGDIYAYPHNVLLESWMELGFIGFVFVLSLYIYASTSWLITKDHLPEFWLGLVVLFYLINALKTGSIYEQRYLSFYLGMAFFFMKSK
ncbi:O-antigen ligase family protein, partial [Vibrio cholerae]|uniref:O-antigen ligase family protein n=2 Tax=Vibrio cholerae TaxID=666 RepID=UPI001C8D4994